MNDERLDLGIDAWHEGIDFRMEADEDGMTFRGYAAVFDSESKDLGGFTETIAPGAFQRSLSNEDDDIKMFVNHDWGRLLASRQAGTLGLEEDDYGLRVEAKLPDTQDGRDVATLTARGDIHSMSIGFRPQDTDILDGGKHQRIRQVRLREVSPVTAWAAYTETQAGVRSLADLIDAQEDEITAAVSVLLSEDKELTEAQRTLLTEAITAHTPTPVTYDHRDRLAALLARYD
jgi:HK97 family phage prohead protease